MQLFYAPDIHEDKNYALTKEESAHCINVLRYSEGQSINLTDGKGSMYKAVIDGIVKNQVMVNIMEQQLIQEDRSYRLHIAIAPTKSIDRFEWFIEKSTEIGIDEITPLITQKSERKLVRIDRLEKIAIAAMKQSIKVFLPIINSPVTITDFLQKYPQSHQKFIAHCNKQDRSLLQDVYRKGDNVIVLIGPEGDFSSDEIEKATGFGFRAISLGNCRLRTETAGIVVCNAIYFLNQ